MDFDIALEGISIGSLQIRFYSLMILSGIGVGVIIAQREAKRYGENPEHVVNIAVLGAITAIVGARLYHVLDRDQWLYYSQNPGDIIKVWNGGIGIFGAMAGAILGLMLYVWWVNSTAKRKSSRASRRMGVLRWLDIGAPAFLVGQAVGRWGNFFNQELYGPPTDLPWGLPIDAAHRPLEYLSDTHFHPLFLYESLLSALGVMALLWLGRRFASRMMLGDMLLLYLIWYGAERFALEFLRFDNWKFGAVPTAQIVGVAFVLGAIAVMVYRHQTRKPDDTPEEQRAERGVTRGAERRRRRRTDSQADG